MRIEIYLLPNAKKNEYAGYHGDRVKLKISSPAIDNAANIAMIDFIASRLEIAKSRIKIIHGEKIRYKLIEIDDDITVDDFIDKLQR